MMRVNLREFWEVRHAGGAGDPSCTETLVDVVAQEDPLWEGLQKACIFIRNQLEKVTFQEASMKLKYHTVVRKHGLGTLRKGFKKSTRVQKDIQNYFNLSSRRLVFHFSGGFL